MGALIFKVVKMASNKDLVKGIEELTAELNLEISTEGMKNKDLSELLSDLKAKVKDASLNTKADEAEGKKYTVVQGKALTTKRGVKANGDEVSPKDVNGGVEVLERLVKSGHLVKA